MKAMEPKFYKGQQVTVKDHLSPFFGWQGIIANEKGPTWYADVPFYGVMFSFDHGATLSQPMNFHSGQLRKA
jgi:hypothetical protein